MSLQRNGFPQSLKALWSIETIVANSAVQSVATSTLPGYLADAAEDVDFHEVLGLPCLPPECNIVEDAIYLIEPYQEDNLLLDLSDSFTNMVGEIFIFPHHKHPNNTKRRETLAIDC